MKNLIFITINLFMVVYIVNSNENSRKTGDDFGEKLNNKRRQFFPTKDTKEKSLLEKLLEVKSNFENAKQDSRAIDYVPNKFFQDRAPTREELIKKLKFDLEPKASISNQTIIIDGLSVSTKQNPRPLASSNLPFDRKILNQLGSFLPGGEPGDNVNDIRAELQEMLFGEEDLDKNNQKVENAEIFELYSDVDDSDANATASANEEDETLYDLFDYLDYTEGIEDEYDEDDKIDLLHSEDTTDEIPEDLGSMDNFDQEAEESIQYNRKVPINFLNISSYSLPLVGNRRQSFVRFPERQLQKQKMSLKSRMRNKQRILQQQLQKEEISSRIVNRKPNRNRYKSADTKLTKNEYGLDYEEISLRRQDRINRNKLKENKNQRTNQRIQNQSNRKTFITNGNNQNLLPLRTEGRDCDYYTSNLCLKVANYPKEQIIALLSGRNRRIGTDLIADVLDQSADELIDGVTSAQENSYTISHYFGDAERRDDNKGGLGDDPAGVRDFAQDGGFLCPSEIKYAKPKRGKTAQGAWKDIVNVNDYTQTLRMEKCLKPGGGCSYVSHHYRSQCSQIYNYHRLLSWDKSRGLHMDIYKVPTCCSCHIMGYSYVYPPLAKKKDAKQTPAQFRSDVSPLPLASQASQLREMPGKKPPVPMQSLRRENTPKKQIFPDLGPPDLGGFKNFMSQMNNKFSFQIARKRDGLVATSTPHKLGESKSRNQGPSKKKSNASQNNRSPHPLPPLNQRFNPNRKISPKKNARPNILGDVRRPIITKRKQQNLNQRNHEGRKSSIPKLIPRINKHITNQLSVSQKDVLPYKIERTKIDLLDRPRSHNPSEDMPKVRYQSIILEEPIEPQQNEKFKDNEPNKHIISLRDKSDKGSKLPKSSSVNYGYHPIIDFFPQYRFDAAHK